MTNVGFDFGLVNNKLTGTVDYFNKRTKDILINLPAPDVHGTASIPKQNSATVTNQGIEMTLGWQDQIGDFSYGVNGNFTFVKTRSISSREQIKAVSLMTGLILSGKVIPSILNIYCVQTA